MPRLLVVHHTPSPAMQAMFEAVIAGTGHEDIDGVQVIVRPALTAGAADVLDADGYLLGTPANIGYMSGALKHFFDGIYYPCLEATQRRPYALYVHGNLDTGGAVRAVESIATGLRWRRAAAGMRRRSAGERRPGGMLGAWRHHGGGAFRCRSVRARRDRDRDRDARPRPLRGPAGRCPHRLATGLSGTKYLPDSSGFSHVNHPRWALSYPA